MQIQDNLPQEFEAGSLYAQCRYRRNSKQEWSSILKAYNRIWGPFFLV